MAQAIQNKPLYDGMKVTREEYLDLEEDGFKYDMIDGVLTLSPSPFFEHNEILSALNAKFFHFLSGNHTGKVAVETDIYLPDAGDVLRPDISVILKENYGIIKGHIHGVPDVVAEVLSKATRNRDLGVKADRYLRNGIKEFWVIDPGNNTVELWINENSQNWRKIAGNRIESSLLQGFVLNTTDVFSQN